MCLKQLKSKKNHDSEDNLTSESANDHLNYRNNFSRVSQHTRYLPKLAQNAYFGVSYHLNGSRSVGMHFHNFLNGEGLRETSSFASSYYIDSTTGRVKFIGNSEVCLISSKNFVADQIYTAPSVRIDADFEEEPN